MDAASTMDWQTLSYIGPLVLLGLAVGGVLAAQWWLQRQLTELDGRIDRMTHLVVTHAVVLAALKGGEEHPYVAKLRQAGVLGDVAVPPEQAEDLGPV